MIAHRRTPQLTEPVSERSRLIRCDGVEIGRLEDVFVLLDTSSRLTCALDAPTARVWFECDGRPLGDVLESLPATAGRPRRDLIDMIRTLRLLGMLEDAEPHDGSPGEGGPDDGSRKDGAGDDGGRDGDTPPRTARPTPLESSLPRGHRLRVDGSAIRSGAARLALISPAPGSRPGTEANTIDSPTAAGPETRGSDATVDLTAEHGRDGIDGLLIIDPSAADERELDMVEALAAVAMAVPECSVDLLVRVCALFRVLVSPTAP